MSNVTAIKKASFLLYRELMNIGKGFDEENEKQNVVEEFDHYTVVSNFKEFLEAADILQGSTADFEMLREYMLMSVDLLEIIRNDEWEEEDSKQTYMKIIQYFEKKMGGEVLAFVNVYRLNRVYGGPEEGGWYYNHLTCIDTKEVPFSSIEKTKEELKEKYGTGEGNIYSVLGGYEVPIYVEEELAKSETKERPYYC